MGKVSKKVKESTKAQQNGTFSKGKTNSNKNFVKSEAILKKATNGKITKAKEVKIPKMSKVAKVSQKDKSRMVLREAKALNSLAKKKDEKDVHCAFKTETAIKMKEPSIETEEEESSVGSLLKMYNLNAPKYDRSLVVSALDGVLALHSKYLKRKKLLFENEEPILLQICLIKIPKTPARIIRVPLMYSTLTENSEICLITADLKNTNLKDYDKNIEYYENILKKHNITNIKTIIPFHQLRNDYSEIESKKRFIELYDLFLVDGKIQGHLMKKFMGTFKSKHKMPSILRLELPNLKEQLERALLKAQIPIHSAGDNFATKVGHVGMEKEHIIANIESVIDSIDGNLPGGFDNIKSLNLKTQKSMSIPIYMNLKNKSTVEDPEVKNKRPKAFKKVKGELTTVPGAVVTVAPSGSVFVKNTGEMKQERLEDNMRKPKKAKRGGKFAKKVKLLKKGFKTRKST